eukprot:8516311-Alexandrium_andersonii.AAC.1
MSASLVGSEMCIRDRSLTCPTKSRTRRPRAPSASSGLCGRLSSSRRWGCLLYTSDAADDM